MRFERGFYGTQTTTFYGTPVRTYLLPPPSTRINSPLSPPRREETPLEGSRPPLDGWGGIRSPPTEGGEMDPRDPRDTHEGCSFPRNRYRGGRRVSLLGRALVGAIFPRQGKEAHRHDGPRKGAQMDTGVQPQPHGTGERTAHAVDETTRR